MTHASPKSRISSDMEQCIRECQHCHKVCLTIITHCLELGGKHAEAAHITLLQDCAEICQTSANFMTRGSGLHPHTCRACAEVCRRCAEDCERMAGNDDIMQECAEACRRCAESCERMAAA